MSTPNDQQPAGLATPGAGALAAIPWEQYRERRADWFPTTYVFQWTLRCHKKELAQCGALALIGRRVHVVPERFDAAVVAIGQRLAQARAA